MRDSWTLHQHDAPVGPPPFSQLRPYIQPFPSNSAKVEGLLWVAGPARTPSHPDFQSPVGPGTITCIQQLSIWPTHHYVRSSSRTEGFTVRQLGTGLPAVCLNRSNLVVGPATTGASPPNAPLIRKDISTSGIHVWLVLRPYAGGSSGGCDLRSSNDRRRSSAGQTLTRRVHLQNTWPNHCCRHSWGELP